MDDCVIPARWRSPGFDDPDHAQYRWEGLHNGYTERGKLAYGIERGIPLMIPSFLWPERRAWLLEMEQEYRAAGHGILAQFCREEIARHDGNKPPTGGCVAGFGSDMPSR